MPKTNGGSIETNIKLTGQDEYKKSLNEAYSNLRRLKSELKATTTAMGNNASAQQKNTAKITNLKQKIAEQKKIVQQLTKAVAQASKEYPQNTELINKWSEKLNNAKAALNSMNNELERLNSGMTQSNNVVTDTAQTTSNWVQGMRAMKGVAVDVGSSIADSFKKTYDTIKKLTEGMVYLMQDAMASIGEWKAITDVYGGSDESVQKFFYGLQSMGIEPSGISSAISALVKRTHSGTNKAALKKYGLTESTEDNHWDYFYDTLGTLSNITDKGERYKAIESVFGSGQVDAIETWLSKWDDINGNIKQQQDANGFVIQAQIDLVDNFTNSMNELETKWAWLKTGVGVSFIVALESTGFTQTASDILDDMTTIFSANATEEEKRQATLSLSADINILADNLSQFLQTLSNVWDTTAQDLSKQDGLAGTIGKLMLLLQDIAGWLASVVDWFSAHPQISDALLKVLGIKTIADATGVSDVVETVTDKVVDFAIFKHLFNGGASTGGGIGTGISNLFGNASAFISSILPQAGLGAFLTGLFVKQNNDINDYFESGANVADFGERSGGDYTHADTAAQHFYDVIDLYDTLMRGGKTSQAYNALQSGISTDDLFGEVAGRVMADTIAQMYANYAYYGWDSQGQFTTAGIPVDEWREILGVDSEDGTGTWSDLYDLIEQYSILIQDELQSNNNNSGSADTIKGGERAINLNVTTTLDGAVIAQNQYPYITRMLAYDM